jgi:hypothetical protein
VFAPFFASGLFFATKRRLVLSYVLYPAILVMVSLVMRLDAPYHEIVDCGVAMGLGLGTVSFVNEMVQAIRSGKLPADVDHQKEVASSSEQLI